MPFWLRKKRNEQSKWVDPDALYPALPAPRIQVRAQTQIQAQTRNLTQIRDPTRVLCDLGPHPRALIRVLVLFHAHARRRRCVLAHVLVHVPIPVLLLVLIRVPLLVHFHVPEPPLGIVRDTFILVTADRPSHGVAVLAP